jgi:hypothetical protein
LIGPRRTHGLASRLARWGSDTCGAEHSRSLTALPARPPRPLLRHVQFKHSQRSPVAVLACIVPLAALSVGDLRDHGRAKRHRRQVIRRIAAIKRSIRCASYSGMFQNRCDDRECHSVESVRSQALVCDPVQPPGNMSQAMLPRRPSQSVSPSTHELPLISSPGRRRLGPHFQRYGMAICLLSGSILLLKQ